MSLVFALTLLFVSKTVALDQGCRPGECPPGYHKKSSCGLNGTWNVCQECPDGRYMNLNNTEKSCIQCSKCGPKKVEQTPCTSVSNRECVEKRPRCSSCQNRGPEVTPGSRIVDCNPKCKLVQPTTPGSKLENTKTTAAAATQSRYTARIHEAAGVSHVLWVLLIILLLFAFCLGVFFLKIRKKYPHLDCCSRDKLQAEDPLQTETDHLQSLTTLNFTIFEETPKSDIMGPAPPENPTHNPQVENRGFPEQTLSESFPPIVLYAVIKEIPLRRWKELMRLLSVTDQQLERVEVDVGLSSIERQYQQLRLWSQKPSANMEDVYSALHYMELAGCAQMIGESLEQMHWKPQFETSL
uniref:Tumor necrosis factor receptor superfamily member 1A-like n=1 Tax=Knipowitschia caucasica TaxID=637954 RepID=A0AAV2LXK6_KNICA